MITVGTAGHIDHGKSSLVEALTGIDPDRLPDEKSRGMTIDLGFAWLQLAEGLEISMVDVPGHERFVRNMVAGVGGIDAALLVVSADEGVMPQTREHVDIMNLLSVRRGVVAVTKIDLVDQELVEMAEDEVRALLRGTSLEHIRLIRTSTKTKEGLEELVGELERICSDGKTIEYDQQLARVPVDRAFTVPGFGTVVTGTLIDGVVREGMELQAWPAGKIVRVRGLQSHEKRTQRVEPGRRVAMNVSGIGIDDLSRGSVLCVPGAVASSRLLDVQIRLLDRIENPLVNAIRVVFHGGTAAVRATIRLLDAEEILPGDQGLAQIRLEQPVATRNGDRFIIRQLSPAMTLGGGIILNPNAINSRRYDCSLARGLNRIAEGDLSALLSMQLDRQGPIAHNELRKYVHLAEEEFKQALDKAFCKGEVVRAGGYVFTKRNWDKLIDLTKQIINVIHKHQPLDMGIAREELRVRLKLAPGPFDDLVAALEREDILCVVEDRIGLEGHEVRLSDSMEQKVCFLLDSLAKSGIGVPSLSASAESAGVTQEVLEMLVRTGRLIRVAPDIAYEKDMFENLLNAVKIQIRDNNGHIDVGGLRDYFHSSRKYSLALLEYLDSSGITRRIGDIRVLRNDE